MAKGGIFNILIILAVLLALGSIYLVTMLINNAREEGRASAKPVPVEMANVLVANADIDAGMEFKTEMVTVKPVPKEFTTADTVTTFDQVKGKVAGGFIPTGDVIFNAKAKNRDQLAKASLVVAPGKRLVSVPSSFEIAVSYMVKNGDHVDILATFDVPKADKDIQGEYVKREITVTLLQNVTVFDIQFGAPPAPKEGSGSSSNGGGEGGEAGRLGKGSTVTFEVSPQEAERLTAAFSKAKSFRLTLRRFDDEGTEKTSSMMETELLKPYLPPEPPAPVVAPTDAPKPVAKPKYNY